MEGLETFHSWGTRSEMDENKGSVAIIVVLLMAMVIITILASKITHMVVLQLEAGEATLSNVVEKYELVATDTWNSR